MERIFEPFFTTKGLEKGTGLGLSTVAAIVKNFEGFVEVQSAVGQGTVFQVFLPMPADAPAEEPAPKLEALPTGRGELILAVDDERFVLELAKTTLEAYGYKVITGRDGLEAISAVQARRQELALLLIDTDMPVLNGIKAIKAIHRLAPKLPIIRASGSHHAWSEEEAARAGVTTTLRKPYGLVELLTAVAQSLQGR